MEHRRVRVRTNERFDRGQFKQTDALERPPVRARNFKQLLFCFRERDVQSLFSAAYSLKKELQSQGGLPRARVALNQVEAIAGQSFSQDFIKSFDAGM